MKNLLKKCSRVLLSAPVFVKIMGIYFLVSGVFGAVLFYHIHYGGIWVHHMHDLEEKALLFSRVLAIQLSEEAVVREAMRIQDTVNQVMHTYEDVSFVVVRDKAGRPWVHNFENAVPEDLNKLFLGSLSENGVTQVLLYKNRHILSVELPLLGGHAGWLQVGVGDGSLIEEGSALSRIVLRLFIWTVCTASIFSFWLTRLVTQPLKSLVRSANQVGKGDFSTRTEIHSDDEVGSLAQAFNRMAIQLQNYDKMVRQKEEKLRELVDKMVNIQEDERKLISQELHDEFGQSLSALNMRVSQECKKGSLHKEACEDMRTQIQAMIEQARLLAWRMRPSVLDDYGLNEALKRLVSDINQHSDMELDYQSLVLCPVCPRPESHVELCFYRIAQEALTNITRHSEAKTVSVVLTFRLNMLSLVIEDDGKGFDEALFPENKHSLGLAGMRERVSMLEGRLVIESVLGKGTLISVSAPLKGIRG